MTTPDRDTPNPTQLEANKAPYEPGVVEHRLTVEDLMEALPPDEAKATLEILDSYLHRLKR